jgi:hypothetical protein
MMPFRSNGLVGRKQATGRAVCASLPTMRVARVRSFFVFSARWTMADVTESAESKQLLESLKGRMLVLKEHL